MTYKTATLAFAASLIVINAFGQFVTCTGTSPQTCMTSNVGIGGTNPTNALHIFTTGQAQGLTIEGLNPALKFQPSGGPAQGYFGLASGTGGAFFNDAVPGDLIVRSEANRILMGRLGMPTSTLIIDGGNVGIGMNPGLRFDVIGTAVVYEGARRVARFFDDSALAVGVGGGIDFVGKYNTAGNFTQFANLKGVKVNGTSGDFLGQLVISVNDSSGNVQERAFIGLAGMTVTGDISATGTISANRVNATYQDVAEWVPASETMRAGTVVVVDRNADNGVLPSSHAYDTGVAGVVSAQPGVILGVESASKAKVATTGRVKVLVDATHAPILRGDLLVTSDEKGLAMKSDPVEVGGRKFHQPGTVIGKALEPLASGRGEILVLLSLQ